MDASVEFPASAASAFVEMRAMLADALERLNMLTEERAMDSLILTTEEAVRFAKLGSDSALYRWSEKWGVSPVAHGRWSRAQIELAMEREAGLTHTPASLKKKQAAAAAAPKKKANAARAASANPTTSGAAPYKANDPVPVGRESNGNPLSVRHVAGRFSINAPAADQGSEGN